MAGCASKHDENIGILKNKFFLSRHIKLGGYTTTRDILPKNKLPQASHFRLVN